MENETVDYGKVTGMVHSTESFGAVDGPGMVGSLSVGEKLSYR